MTRVVHGTFVKFLSEISSSGDAAHSLTHASMAEAKERGNALYKAGKFVEAVAAYDESIGIDPTVASVHANRAAALSGQGRRFFGEAVKSCVAAVCLDPAYARARQRLGALAIKLGELDTATAAAEDALRADPESPGAIALVKQMRALRDGRAEGNAAFKAGDKPKARHIYTAALERAASAAASGPASAAASGPASGPASDPAALAADAAPGAALLLCNRAACASAAGDHAAALADVDAALAADPEYLKAALRRAHALRDLGRAADAEAQFVALRGALPGDAAVAEALNRLRGDDAERAGPIHVECGGRYRALVDKAKLCLVDFTASWCGPCRQIAPHFERLALTHPSVHFLKVDVDEAQEIAAAENVRSMPTFKLYRYGAKVEEFSGADPGKLAALIDRYLPTVA